MLDTLRDDSTGVLTTFLVCHVVRVVLRVVDRLFAQAGRGGQNLNLFPKLKFLAVEWAGRRRRLFFCGATREEDV